MFAYSQIQKLTSNHSNIILKKSPTRGNTFRVYLEKNGEKKQHTLFTYVKFDACLDRFSSGYFAIKSWMKDFKELKQRSHLAQQDGLFFKDISIEEVKNQIDYLAGISKQITPTRKKKNQRIDSNLTEAVKELNQYTCDCCGVNLNLTNLEKKLKRKLIQVHHRTRGLHGNRDHISNLQTLCTICHGHQEGKGHSFQRNNVVHHHILKEIRATQGIL